MEKIIEFLRKVKDLLSNTVSIGKNLALIAAVIYLVYSLPLVWDSIRGYNKPTVTEVQKIDVPIIQEVTQENIRTSERVFDDIKNAEPVVVLSPTATEEEVQREIDKLDGKDIIVTPSNTPGTSIYSIRVHKHRYGIGLYADVNEEFGLHYRNKRWIYQLGMDKDKDITGRIAFELLHW